MPFFIRMIGRGFANLFNFSGRDRPGQFWPYAGLLVIVQMAIGAMAMMQMMMTVFLRIEDYARTHPDEVRIETGPGGEQVMHMERLPPELMPDFSVLAPIIAFNALAMVLLLAAAVARRLHDRGKSGLWGLLPVPFLAGGLFFMTNLFATFRGEEPNLRLFGFAFLNNLLYLAMLACLVVMLVKRGDEGENRYGPPPPLE
jgi:uncharacterized membrane protein YhaH (DUF805 family)